MAGLNGHIKFGPLPSSGNLHREGCQHSNAHRKQDIISPAKKLWKEPHVQMMRLSSEVILILSEFHAVCVHAMRLCAQEACGRFTGDRTSCVARSGAKRKWLSHGSPTLPAQIAKSAPTDRQKTEIRPQVVLFTQVEPVCRFWAGDLGASNGALGYYRFALTKGLQHFASEYLHSSVFISDPQQIKERLRSLWWIWSLGLIPTVRTRLRNLCVKKKEKKLCIDACFED